MEAPFDLEEEAKAADLLAVHLGRVEAPQKLIDQARQQAAELRKEARSVPAAETAS
jgi:lactate dehydrogenase-like 2-hydroxyacid dehydrogenase